MTNFIHQSIRQKLIVWYGRHSIQRPHPVRLFWSHCINCRSTECAYIYTNMYSVCGAPVQDTYSAWHKKCSAHMAGASSIAPPCGKCSATHNHWLVVVKGGLHCSYLLPLTSWRAIIANLYLSKRLCKREVKIISKILSRNNMEGKTPG